MKGAPGAPAGEEAAPIEPGSLAGPAAPSGPVPQRLTLVLPSTAEFDSRTYRIASAAAARGHVVTVLARRRPGLPAVERHPAGYTILRVPFAAIDGLPLPRLVFAGRVAVRRFHAWRTRTPYRPPTAPGQVAPAGSDTPGQVAPAGSDTLAEVAPEARAPVPTAVAPGSSRSTAPASPERRASVPRRAVSGLVRRLAIPLTIRSQGRWSRAVAPAADMYHGMAYMGIPIALGLAKRDRARVVYDARDIYMDAANLARMTGPMRTLLARAERGWARRADRVVTVNRPYAEVMAERFGVPLPLIVLNCSYRFTPPEPRHCRFHEALGLEPATRVVLYQGGFSPDRGIEQLIAAIPSLPGSVLVLLGYGILEARLRASAAASNGRVRLLPGVPPTELLAWIAAANVVAMPIQPTTLNHRLTTPNKLFEAMAAGVPVVASDLPGMAPIVRETGCGLLCDPRDPAAIASALRAILDAPPEARDAYRSRALRAAHDIYSWEAQVELLFAEYGRLTGNPW